MGSNMDNAPEQPTRDDEDHQVRFGESGKPRAIYAIKQSRIDIDIKIIVMIQTPIRPQVTVESDPNRGKPELMDVLIAGQKRQRDAETSAREAKAKLADCERDERAAIAEFNEAKKKMEAATAAVNQAREEVSIGGMGREY